MLLLFCGTLVVAEVDLVVIVVEMQALFSLVVDNSSYSDFM
jgi:hypothetical protein